MAAPSWDIAVDEGPTPDVGLRKDGPHVTDHVVS